MILALLVLIGGSHGVFALTADDLKPLAEDDFDADSQFCLHWFEQHGWETAKFGEADTLARAKGTSVAGVQQAGVIEAGGGNAQMQLEFKTKLKKANIVNQKPLHHQFDMQDPRFVVPGHPERSVMLHRIAQRDKGHMPPLATRVVDQAAVEMLREWIQGMKKE